MTALDLWKFRLVPPGCLRDLIMPFRRGQYWTKNNFEDNMSGRSIHILAVMMAVVSFVSCGRVRTGHELGRIESELRSGSAHSAVLMLSRMERNRMPKAQAARFTVLNAMAADKLYIDDGSLLPSLDMPRNVLFHDSPPSRSVFQCGVHKGVQTALEDIHGRIRS